VHFLGQEVAQSLLALALVPVFFALLNLRLFHLALEGSWRRRRRSEPGASSGDIPVDDLLASLLDNFVNLVFGKGLMDHPSLLAPGVRQPLEPVRPLQVEGLVEGIKDSQVMGLLALLVGAVVRLVLVLRLFIVAVC